MKEKVQRLMKKLREKKGFTLIELIVVIAILGILAAIIIPQFGGFQDKARSAQNLVDAKQVATAAEALYAENNTVPTAAQVQVVAGGDIAVAAIGSLALDAATKHITFTYTQKIPAVTGKTFVTTRAADGSFSTTWS